MLRLSRTELFIDNDGPGDFLPNTLWGSHLDGAHLPPTSRGSSRFVKGLLARQGEIG